jgi:hypothetical protein
LLAYQLGVKRKLSRAAARLRNAERQIKNP